MKMAIQLSEIVGMTNTPTEDWMNRKWRPAMGWTYMVICILDFAIFPILWSIIQAAYSGRVDSQWDPITLRGAGLFHMAMGAILGIAAWTRGQEKIAGVATDTTTLKPVAKVSQTEDPPLRNTRND
jgi:hypothetical protein